MSDFRTLSDQVMVSPQIDIGNIAEAAELGVSLIINNRPDGESADQISGDDIEKAAKSSGLAYLAIPITQAGFSASQIEAMSEALSEAEGKVLAYCRSGTRSTFLWSLAQAKGGKDPVAIVAAAQAAGYDISPIKPSLDALAQQAMA